MSAATLLIEIGCEELPYRFCESVLQQLRDDAGRPGLVRRLLDEARLLPQRDAPPRVLVSPRRLAVLVPGVPARQTALVQRVRGPRADVAFGPDGAATRAGAGFARGKGLEPADLERETVDGNEFVVAVVEAERREAAEVLPQVVARLVAGIQVPRGMRWGGRPSGEHDFLRFSRPIRWLVCKHGAGTVPGAFYGLTMGDVTQGHRVLGASSPVADADAYEQTLAAQHVVVDHEERRRRIVAGLDDQAAAAGGAWDDPGDVLAETVFLTEWPSVARGAFDPRHLRLPDPVLVTAMQSHQRYVAVRDGDGALLPSFLYVGNGAPQAEPVVTHGNERVLEGRLDDAEFAYDRDLAEGLPHMAGRLDAVAFHEVLGTLADKARRLQGLVVGLAAGSAARGEAGAPPSGGDGADPEALGDVLRQAAALAKADLVSQVVIEFPALQGVMGGIYARHAGLPEQVARAVEQHYRPSSATAPLPDTTAAALLAVADKVDNVAGAWLAGEKPSGSRDPYGLRRAAMGIVRICRQADLRVPIASLMRMAIDQYELQEVVPTNGDRAAVEAEMAAFVRERLEGLLLDEGLAYAAVQAALGADTGDVPAKAARARAFAALAGSAHLDDVVTAYNRCRSLAGTAAEAAAAADPALFELEAERGLHTALDDARAPLAAALERLAVEDAVTTAAALRAPVDRYFDDVLVMADDEAVRANRLAQLRAVVGLLAQLGDFSHLPVPGERESA